MKVFAVIAATVAVASAQSLAVKKQVQKWTPVNFGAARGHNCLTANGKAAKNSRDCDIQASAYPKLCVSVGGQCGMSLANAEANCGAIKGCAGVFCAPYYSDATRCLARSKAEIAGKYIHRVKGVYNKIKRAPIKRKRVPIKKFVEIKRKPIKRAPIKRAPIKKVVEIKRSCSKVELKALQEKFWPYYQKVNGDYDAKKSGRIDMKAIAHFKFLHQKCGDQAYMKVVKKAPAFKKAQNVVVKKVVKKVDNEIKRAPIRIEHKPLAKIDEPREHFKLCDAQNCANWACKEWCHCFDEKAEHLGLYEHHGCDEDASSGACECETTGNGATFSVEDQMFLKKRNHELMKKTTKTAWSADMKRLAPRVKTMEIAAKHKFVAAKHK